ncbi:hypothetical protein BG55_09040 [Erwinia mallotivora]|uniref:Uncharacterized protein n=1 Tax=Erwinia mallotivora TaxID=69222 RepID=A0A014PY00_9GAMM|nr:hypothetical protein BG55_09040 [Erwinia mallotivora]
MMESMAVGIKNGPEGDKVEMISDITQDSEWDSAMFALSNARNPLSTMMSTPSAVVPQTYAIQNPC